MAALVLLECSRVPIIRGTRGATFLTDGAGSTILTTIYRRVRLGGFPSLVARVFRFV